MEIVVGILIGVALVLGAALWVVMSKTKRVVAPVQTHSSLLEMRSVGELVVFRVVTKEIVAASEHMFGEVGKNYLSWLVSGKKMAMIFEFGIDFKYDLRSKDFVIEEQGGGDVAFRMPRCHYETHNRDVSFYDEQSTKLLPGLLPEVISRLFGGGFREEDKHRLKEAARAQADALARAMVERMRPEVQISAEQTLRALARGFGAKQIAVDFSASALVPLGKIEITQLDHVPTQPKALP